VPEKKIYIERSNVDDFRGGLFGLSSLRCDQGFIWWPARKGEFFSTWLDFELGIFEPGILKIAPIGFGDLGPKKVSVLFGVRFPEKTSSSEELPIFFAANTFWLSSGGIMLNKYFAFFGISTSWIWVFRRQNITFLV
jgi:hypothetical protein